MQTSSLGIELAFRVYILDLAIILFYNFTHIYITYNNINFKNLNKLINSTIVFKQLF